MDPVRKIPMEFTRKSLIGNIFVERLGFREVQRIINFIAAAYDGMPESQKKLKWPQLKHSTCKCIVGLLL